MKWQSRDNAHKSRRHSAFVVSSHGKSAGQIVVAPTWRTVPAIAQTQSREWAPREERVGCHASGRAERRSGGSGGDDEGRSWVEESVTRS